MTEETRRKPRFFVLQRGIWYKACASALNPQGDA
jgi:hypothetical protein